MQLNIQLDPSKSALFLDLLAVLKRDKMINDFQIISTEKTKPMLNEYEKELLDDLSHLSEAIDSANSGKGIDANRHVSINL